MSQTSLRDSLDLVEVKTGLFFSVDTLRTFIPDAATAVFFAHLYEMDHIHMSALLSRVLNTDLASALFNEGEGHSSDLQDYIVDIASAAGVDMGQTTFNEEPPKGEILPEVWAQLEVEVAQSIKDVAAKLEGVIGLLPGKQGSMVFESMMKMNKLRPTIGVHGARITHERQKENLVILDVSGSMNSDTVGRIVEDVVAMSYMANAHMAIVSDSTTYWIPGSYSVEDILTHATYCGTHYETLVDLFDRDWGTVITIADYDSSYGAKEHIANNSVGSIDTVLDISLVNRPTFLAECVGQLATEVRPLLVANSRHVLRD
jgi:hypothetical protein